MKMLLLDVLKCLPANYSEPLPETAVRERASNFAEKAIRCMDKQDATLILQLVPHKKNGTLHKNRVTTLLKANCVARNGNDLVMYAKNMDDTTLEINFKEVYIGEPVYGNYAAAEALFKAK